MRVGRLAAELDRSDAVPVIVRFFNVALPLKMKKLRWPEPLPAMMLAVVGERRSVEREVVTEARREDRRVEAEAVDVVDRSSSPPVTLRGRERASSPSDAQDRTFVLLDRHAVHDLDVVGRAADDTPKWMPFELPIDVTDSNVQEVARRDRHRDPVARGRALRRAGPSCTSRLPALRPPSPRSMTAGEDAFAACDDRVRRRVRPRRSRPSRRRRSCIAS